MVDGDCVDRDPAAAILKRFQPASDARHVAFTTVARPRQMPGLSYPVLDWPYRVGLRIDEAMHPLTILATGIYGHELPAQNGAPLRLVVPWKYGYKSIKSIVRIEITVAQPATSWNQSAPDEYGFYSDVNPAVSHPRWSQDTERRIAGDGFSFTGNRLQTLPFSGHAEQVASLYPAWTWSGIIDDSIIRSHRGDQDGHFSAHPGSIGNPDLKPRRTPWALTRSPSSNTPLLSGHFDSVGNAGRYAAAKSDWVAWRGSLSTHARPV